MALRRTIDEIISGHKARNASLRGVFLEKKVDLKEARRIEFHFWTWSRKDTSELAESLKSRGFDIMRQQPAGIAGDSERWDLEVAVRQSIDVTLRPEFTDELARLADSHHGLYDGWGTSI